MLLEVGLEYSECVRGGLAFDIRWQRDVHVQLSSDGAKLSQHVAVVLRPPVFGHSGGKLGEFLLHAV